MEVPTFLNKFGKGNWVKTAYVLDRCPLCGGNRSIMFTGRGMWGCSECSKGGNTLDSFRAELKRNPVMIKFADFPEPIPPAGMIVVSEYVPPKQSTVIGTGFGTVDQIIGGLTEGALTVVTGRRAEGKSTLLGQVALNAIDQGHKVGFYSGELSTGRFRSWIYSQAAGARNMESFIDPFGATRWTVKPEIEGKISKWLGEKLVLYDNTKVRASERHTIVKGFADSRAYYGCDLFIIDNLMTARVDTDDDSDALRAQANFASEALDFARMNNVHVILVAHPRKGDNGDINDCVAGLSDITNMATNVIQVRKAKDEEKANLGCDSIITVAKNREHGETGAVKFTFDKTSKRFVPMNGATIARYGWER